MNPGVRDVQTERAELRKQQPGFCSRTRTAGVDVGAACRTRIGMHFAFVMESMTETILGGRGLRMLR